MNFTARKMWELDLKSRYIKKGMVLDNTCYLYLILWNQCTLALKSKSKSHLKHTITEKLKDTIALWLLIEEICTSTSSINSVTQRALKAGLSIGNIYQENMELAKYYKVFWREQK